MGLKEWKEKYKKFGLTEQEYRRREARRQMIEDVRKERNKNKATLRKRLANVNYKKGGARYVRAIGQFAGGRTQEIYSARTKSTLTPPKPKVKRKRIIKRYKVKRKKKR